MANTKSAAKRARQTVVRTERNRSVKSGLKTKLKSARAAISSKDKSAAATGTVAATAALDRAVKRGVIHKNAASRRKSRLAKAVAALG